MNKTLNMALRLLIICAVSALVLGVVNAFTAPEIKRLEDEAKAKALSSLITRGRANPDKEIVVENNENISSYYLIESGGETIGYILYLNAKGYGGPMKVMASYQLDGTVMNSKLMANQETPGFGKNAEKPGYMKIFQNRGNGVSKIPLYTYEVDNPDVVSGATITFMGISSSLKEGSDFVKGGLK